MIIAWASNVELSFAKEVVAVCRRTSIENPSWLMACMAFETGETFSPSIRNFAGSGATGLIQFMPSTAKKLGTTTDDLAKMTAVEQLQYVEKYFSPYRNRLKSLADVYGAILWPAMIGKPDAYVLFDRDDPKYPKRYQQNRGLDYDKDGKITKAEVVVKVTAKLSKGVKPPYVGRI